MANPVATCSLHVLRRDSSLLIKLLADRPKPNAPPGATEEYLFAQSKITLDLSSNAKDKMKMEHWIETVTDSSRYFVIRISDEKRGKEAHIGMGFRERNDAMNFKMSLQEYENTMRKEGMIMDGEHNSEVGDNDSCNDSDSLKDAKSFTETEDSTKSTVEGMSKLSLKEGEKIHINLKGSSSTKSSRAKKSSTPNNSKPPMLLRKPPPPASSSKGASPAMVIDTDALRMSRSKDDRGNLDTGADSVAAVAEIEDDDDEWGDFESPSFDVE